MSVKPFNHWWKDQLSCHPDVPLDWNEREKIRKIAEIIYNEMADDFSSQLDAAYDMGYVEGRRDDD